MKSLQEELLDMAAQWKVDAVTVIERSPIGSHASVANKMLIADGNMGQDHCGPQEGYGELGGDIPKVCHQQEESEIVCLRQQSLCGACTCER
jgi:hypothetical protein